MLARERRQRRLKELAAAGAEVTATPIPSRDIREAVRQRLAAGRPTPKQTTDGTAPTSRFQLMEQLYFKKVLTLTNNTNLKWQLNFIYLLRVFMQSESNLKFLMIY